MNKIEKWLPQSRWQVFMGDYKQLNPDWVKERVDMLWGEYRRCAKGLQSKECNISHSGLCNHKCAHYNIGGVEEPLSDWFTDGRVVQPSCKLWKH